MHSATTINAILHIDQIKLPASIPHEISAHYAEGHLMLNCFWENQSIKIRFLHTQSFRVSREALDLKLGTQLLQPKLSFLYSIESPDFSQWLHNQHYDHLCPESQKVIAVSPEEVIEISFDGEIEFIIPT